jgi:murein DD-endopeptidase MepM/ murein hydrolase activator NlpD
LRVRIAGLRIAALAIPVCAIAAAASPVQAKAPVAELPPGAQIAAGAPSAPGAPIVSRATCKTVCHGRLKATTGSVVKVKGEFLDYAEQVVFHGPAGPMPAALTYRSATLVKTVVPAGAVNSKPFVVDSRGRHSNRAPRMLKIVPAPAPAGPGVFPVQGPHNYGGPDARFGAPRNGHTHQGQDVIAACGTPLVSVMAATVQYTGYQASGAGNYIVLDNNGTEDDFVYMHLAAPPLIRTVGAPVAAGQQVGVVGQTGDAEGCHLHFEYWQGDWYGGGQPIDPLPFLLSWDPSY